MNIRYLKLILLLLLVLTSAVLAFCGISGWGWFLFAAVVITPYLV